MKKLRVVAFNGSPRPKGNTSILIEELFKVLNKHGIDTELVSLKGRDMNGCTACGRCRKEKSHSCLAGNTFINDCIAKMIDADGVIFGSPVYFADVTPEIKSLIDVAGFVTRAEELLKHKVGAAVVVARRAGMMPTFNTMNNFFLINQMIIPGNTYWNVGIAKAEGDVAKDEEGLQIMRSLAENMAFLLKKLNA